MSHPTTNADVIVIGAGLSGLESALTLQEAGLTITVLEGRRRIGGRLYTLDQVPGKPEVGGNIVSRAYGRVIAASSRYGVPLRDDAPRYAAFPDRQVIFIGGRAINAAAWAQHPANPFVGEERSLLPAAWGRTVLNRYRPFDDLENWHQPQHADLDISVYDFLRSRGATPAAIRLGYETNMPYGTESSHDVSILQLAFVDHWQRINQRQLGAGDRFVGIFEGGNQPLPIAMAKRLNGDLLLDRHVVAIEQTKENILVRCSDGSRHHARAVVSSMPFTTLRHVHLDPLPAPLQNRAIQTLGAKPITQFHLLPRRPFWDDDGLSPAFWTDGLAGSVLANRDPKDPKTVTSLTVWCSAANARFLDRYSEADAARIVIAEIERLRPAARGALEVAAVHSWERDPHAAGTWAIFRPGQVALTSHLAKPHNKLFFCGEHTALAARGMEAAFESAERVSLEVLDALS